jgi:hypothetical protein
MLSGGGGRTFDQQYERWAHPLYYVFPNERSLLSKPDTVITSIIARINDFLFGRNVTARPSLPKTLATNNAGKNVGGGYFENT